MAAPSRRAALASCGSLCPHVFNIDVDTGAVPVARPTHGADVEGLAAERLFQQGSRIDRRGAARVDRRCSDHLGTTRRGADLDAAGRRAARGFGQIDARDKAVRRQRAGRRGHPLADRAVGGRGIGSGSHLRPERQVKRRQDRPSDRIGPERALMRIVVAGAVRQDFGVVPGPVRIAEHLFVKQGRQHIVRGPHEQGGLRSGRGVILDQEIADIGSPMDEGGKRRAVEPHHRPIVRDLPKPQPGKMQLIAHRIEVVIGARARVAGDVDPGVDPRFANPEDLRDSGERTPRGAGGPLRGVGEQASR